jgi:hypothetical protein
MAKTAIGLFEASAIADEIVGRLLAVGFSRAEIKLVRASDFDVTPWPEHDILKLGVPAEHAGAYWDAVRSGRTLVAVTSAGDTADRAAGIMNQYGAIDVGERPAPEAVGAHAKSSDDSSFFPPKQAARLFTVS